MISLLDTFYHHFSALSLTFTQNKSSEQPIEPTDQSLGYHEEEEDEEGEENASRQLSNLLLQVKHIMMKSPKNEQIINNPSIPTLSSDRILSNIQSLLPRIKHSTTTLTKKLLSSHSPFQENLHKLQIENEALIERINLFQQKNNAQFLEIEKLQLQIKQLQEENERVLHQLTSLSQNDELKQKSNELQILIQQLKQDNQLYQEQNKQLQLQYDLIQKDKNEFKNQIILLQEKQNKLEHVVIKNETERKQLLQE